MNEGTNGSDREPHPVSVELLLAVADVRNEDVQSIPPLGFRFDPDALDRFIESATVPAEVTIEIYDCTVTIDAEGDVTVTHTHTSW